jgi:hypothetical protein
MMEENYSISGWAVLSCNDDEPSNEGLPNVSTEDKISKTQSL